MTTSNHMLCNNCGVSISLDESGAGTNVACPVCQTFQASKSTNISDMPDLTSSLLHEAEQSTKEVLSDGTVMTSESVGQTTQKFGRFEIKRLMGVGGFGRVYLAYDPELDREVALKILTLGPKHGNRVQRFLLEAKAAARLKHPNIVPVFMSGQIESRYFIASEYIDGEPLSNLRKKTTMSTLASVELVHKLAEAIAYAHDNDVVHRDIKPQNIMVDRRGEPHLMDFGLAKLVDDDAKLTSDKALLGTPAYMSPEQARGETDGIGPASDQYSLAIVLFQLLTGTLPFQGAPHLIIIANVASTPLAPIRTFRADLRADLAAVCDRALSFDPDKRYPSCREFASDLKNWLERRPVRARPLKIQEQVARFVAANRTNVAFTAVLVTLLTCIVLIRSLRPIDRETSLASGDFDSSGYRNAVQTSLIDDVSPVAKARAASAVAAVVQTESAPDSAEVSSATESLRQEFAAQGWFGFPQSDAAVFHDDDDLRLSAVCDSQHLFVQAVLWKDDDDALGQTSDGRSIGDRSSLNLDVDNDQKATPQVDRVYHLNVWPYMSGLSYQVVISDNARTTLKTDSAGTGCTRYVESGNCKMRVDTYVLPLTELNIDGTSTLRASFSAESTSPTLRVAHSSFDLKLNDISRQFDISEVPDGRNDPPLEKPIHAIAKSIVVGQPTPEIHAEDWVNTNSAVSLASMKGKLVLLEFWATWCGPCVAGIPHLNDLQNRYGDKNFRVVSLTKEDRATVDALFARQSERAIYTIGVKSQTPDLYGVSAIPAAFLIGKDGNLLWQGHPGTPQCEQAIASALAVPFTMPKTPTVAKTPPGKTLDVGETLAAAAKSKPIHDALMAKIARDKDEVQRYRRGHVIVGRVQLEKGDDPQTVGSQMVIGKNGFFSDALKDLERPVGFTKIGYRRFMLLVPKDAVPDADGIIDVGTLVMEKIPESEVREATGRISLEGGGKVEATQITLSLQTGLINTPHNGTEGGRGGSSVTAKVDSSGKIVASGLTEGNYYVSYRHQGYVSTSLSTIKVDPTSDTVLPPVVLELPRKISIEYIVARDPATEFNISDTKTVELVGGANWKSRPDIYGWDLAFEQKDGRVSFRSFYSPCYLKDLGEGALEDHLKADLKNVAGTVGGPVQSGHCYVLNQRHWQHHVLFKINIGPPIPAGSGQPDGISKRKDALGVPGVVAHYTFDGHGDDLNGTASAFELKNTSFAEDALILNGKYEHSGGQDGFRAVCHTPTLNYDEFTVVLRFKAESFGPQRRNILAAGPGYRWFRLSSADDGTLSVSFNNSRVANSLNTKITTGRWYEVICAVSVSKRMVAVVVDRESPRVISLPGNFQLEVTNASKDVRDREKAWTFTNYAGVDAFHGAVDELTILDGIMSEQKFNEIRAALKK